MFFGVLGLILSIVSLSSGAPGGAVALVFQIIGACGSIAIGYFGIKGRNEKNGELLQKCLYAFAAQTLLGLIGYIIVVDIAGIIITIIINGYFLYVIHQYKEILAKYNLQTQQQQAQQPYTV